MRIERVGLGNISAIEDDAARRRRLCRPHPQEAKQANAQKERRCRDCSFRMPSPDRSRHDQLSTKT